LKPLGDKLGEAAMLNAAIYTAIDARTGIQARVELDDGSESSAVSRGTTDP